MKWYLVIKVALLLYGTEGPFETKDDCSAYLAHKKADAVSAYEQGVRYTWMGIEVNPQNVSATCKLQ